MTDNKRKQFIPHDELCEGVKHKAWSSSYDEESYAKILNKLIGEHGLYTRVDETACLICGLPNCPEHHIKSRGSGGGEQPWNKVRLCVKHHTGPMVSIHWKGINTFAEDNEIFKEYLISNGWEYCETNERWFHGKS